MRDTAGAGLDEQPGVGDAEERARGLRVDERSEGASDVLDYAPADRAMGVGRGWRPRAIVVGSVGAV